MESPWHGEAAQEEINVVYLALADGTLRRHDQVHHDAHSAFTDHVHTHMSICAHHINGLIVSYFHSHEHKFEPSLHLSSTVHHEH